MTTRVCLFQLTSTRTRRTRRDLGHNLKCILRVTPVARPQLGALLFHQEEAVIPRPHIKGQPYVTFSRLVSTPHPC